MPSDAKQFSRAMRKWSRMQQEENFSVPHREGTGAFVFSINGSISESEPQDIERQAAYYEREAHLLARRFREELGRRAICVGGLTHGTMQRVLEDRQITDVIVIGDGSFSYVYSDEPSLEEEDDIIVDWRDVSELSTHLKTGSFIQRTCGLFEYDLGVPFGAFAMQNHMRLYAPLNKPFGPEHSDDAVGVAAEEAKMVRVYDEAVLSYEAIKRRFKKGTV